jgi:hypothetical protein
MLVETAVRVGFLVTQREARAMKTIPFVVFGVCAAIAGAAAGAALLAPSPNPPVTAIFLFVFFGLAALVLPVVIAVQTNGKENRQRPGGGDPFRSNRPE